MVSSKINFLLSYPQIGRAISSIFGLLEVPILEFRRMIDKYIAPGFFERSEAYFNRFYGSTVIPINTVLESEYKISSTEEIISIIERLPSLAIGYCYCRTIRKNCDNPKWTCIHVGTAQKLSAIGERTPIKSTTVEEVKDLLYEADNRGLVHQLITAPNKDYFYTICNCCPCCCVMLNSVNRLNKASIVSNSNFVILHDVKECTHCGECVKRCYFDALITVDNRTICYEENCVGCGLCISKCEFNAIKLIERNKFSREISR